MLLEACYSLASVSVLGCKSREFRHQTTQGSERASTSRLLFNDRTDLSAEVPAYNAGPTQAPFSRTYQRLKQRVK